MRVRTPRGPATLRRAALGLISCAILALPLAADAPAAANPAAGGPIAGAVETSDASWAVLPMGQLSDPANTFWQLLHAVPGSSRWAVVTPRGVADNGGLVAGLVTGAALVGTLPSQLLHFSPLSLSSDGGRTWSPVFLPGGLAPRPDALAYGVGPQGGLAIVGRTVLSARPGLSSWSPVVSLSSLQQVSPRCGASTLDAVTFGAATSTPMVATGCRSNGQVAVFEGASGSWRLTGVRLRGRLAGSSTAVLRLETSGLTTTALVDAKRGGRRALVALWLTSAGQWRVSAPLPLGQTDSVVSTATSGGGGLAVLIGSGPRRSADEISPGRGWAHLPAPPRASVDLAAVAPVTTTSAAIAFDAFTVDGAVLNVFALTPAGNRWVATQTLQVPLAYGSSG